MSYNETITLINYAKDLEIEYNLKLVLMITAFIYCVALFYLSFKWDNDKYFIKIIKNLLIRIPFAVFIFFFPLFSILLLRTASWEIFYGFMVTFYGYAFIILLISGYLGMFEWALDLLGFKLKLKEMKMRNGKRN